MSVRIKTLAVCVALSASSAALAQNALDLSRYTLTHYFSLPAYEASEASAITYDWDRGSLFVVGDEGNHIVEMSRTGEHLSTMRLSGFEDTEGLTYVGNGQFVIAEERQQSLHRFTYTADGLVSRHTLPAYSLGSYSNNQGIEGVSYDPRDGSFVAVKEKGPQAVYHARIGFDANTGSHSALFAPGGLGLLDLSDVQVLSTVPSFIGSGFEDNLLVFSQESKRLLEVTRDGEVLSFFDFSRFDRPFPPWGSSTAEGVTIDERGWIYIAEEGGTPGVFVLTPTIPEPETYALMLAGLAVVGWAARRRREA